MKDKDDWTWWLIFVFIIWAFVLPFDWLNAKRKSGNGYWKRVMAKKERS